MSYIDIPTDTDPSQLATNAFDFIQGFFPDWTPNAASLATVLIQANSETAAEVKDVSSKVPSTIFRYFGDSLSSIHPIDAAPSTVMSHWTTVDHAGYTIENGTTVVVRDDTGTFIGFIVVGGPYVIDVGDHTADVQLQAVIAGEASNNLDADNEASPQDQLAFVESIVLTDESGGGAEAETDDTYLNRLSEELTLQAPMPILAPDFAVLARRIPGVFRATVVDNWDNALGVGDRANTLTIFAVDSNGNAVGSTVKTAISDYFEATRAQNFKVYVGDPTYTTVNVTFSIGIISGNAPDVVKADAEQAVRDYLSKANWGNPAGSDPARWINSTVVRVNKVIQAIENTTGVEYATSVQLNGSSSDITLSGIAPLPQSGTVTGTVL